MCSKTGHFYLSGTLWCILRLDMLFGESLVLRPRTFLGSGAFFQSRRGIERDRMGLFYWRFFRPHKVCPHALSHTTSWGRGYVI